MSHPDQFAEILPSPSQTHSHGPKACRVEHCVEGRPHFRPCMPHAGEMALKNIEYVFGHWIKVTLCEESASIVARSEHQFNHDNSQRLSRRKHFYELLHTPGANRRVRWTSYELTTARTRELRDGKAFDHLGIPPGVVDRILDVLDRAAADVPPAIVSSGLKLRRYLETCGMNDVLKLCLPGLRPKVWRIIENSLAVPALSCLQLDSSDRFGSYLGFLDLRLSCAGSPVALAVLAVPRAFRDSPSCHVMTGQYGPLFGGEAFPATVYSMVDHTWSGASCSQMCIVMASGILSDRGAQIHGPFTLTYLGQETKPLKADLPEKCVARLAAQAGRGVEGAFTVDGLSYQGIIRALRHCDVAVEDVQLRYQRQESDELARQLIAACVHARFPILLPVDLKVLHNKHDETTAAAANAVERHAVVVVGYRGAGCNDQPLSLIVHDPTHAPYWESPVDTMLGAVRAFFAKTGEPAPQGLRFLIIADKHLKQGPGKVLEAALRLADAADQLDPDSIVMHARPLNLNVLLEPQDNLQIRLLHRDEIALHAHPADNARRHGLARLVNHLGASRYWCVETRNRDGVLRRLIVADADAGFLKCIELARDGEAVPEERLSTHVAAVTWTPSPAQKITPRQPHPSGTIQPAVITSSTIRSLRALAPELHRVAGVAAIDLMLLRPVDIQAILHAHPVPNLAHSISTSELLNNDHGFAAATTWIKEQLDGASAAVAQHDKSAKLVVAALATYFPDVSSIYSNRRDVDIKAIVRTVLLAIELTNAGFMPRPIVEIVCGSILDRCSCAACLPAPDDAGILVSSARRKREKLVEDLAGVVIGVHEELARQNKPFPSFGLALELEPGPTYILNNTHAIREMSNMLLPRNGTKPPTFASHLNRSKAGRTTTDALETKHLKEFIGFNVDIAHMRIAEVDVDAIEGISDLIVHAHVADHPPRMHTRDQQLGEWTPIESRPEAYGCYFDILRSRAAKYKGTGLPFSGHISLELEGCDRIAWVRNSLAGLKYLCARK